MLDACDISLRLDAWSEGGLTCKTQAVGWCCPVWERVGVLLRLFGHH